MQSMEMMMNTGRAGNRRVSLQGGALYWPADMPGMQEGMTGDACLGNVVAFFIIIIISIGLSVQYLLQIYLESKLLDCWLCL